MRRLPVYLLIDTSGSMRGEPIEAVKMGLETMVSTLRGDPFALETAWLSIITFSDWAQQVVPLTELSAFQQPNLHAAGRTALGGALALVAQCVDREVRKTTYEQKGDWKPLVFIMTDGRPGDNLKRGIGELKKRKFGMVVACATGRKANMANLQQITENVVQLETVDSVSIKAFFKWVSASVSASSMKVEGGEGEVTKFDQLPPPPPEVNLVV